MASIIKVDSLQEKTSGNGIILENSLKDSTGTNEIISPSGGMTIPSGQSIKNSSGTSLIDATGTISSDMVFPAGHIVQVKRAFNNSAFSDTVTASWQYIPNLSIDITPTSGNSKFLIIANLTGGSDASAAHNYMSLGIKRTAPVDVLVGQKLQVVTQDPYGYAVPHILLSLDDPQTLSQITYKIGYNDDNSTGGSIYINQIYTGSYVYQSEMVVMEISQ